MEVDKLKKLKHFPIHPLLWALFPPLALLGNNISHILPVDTIRTLLVSMAMALLLMGIFRPILGSWNKAALVVTGFLLLFYSYGHIYNLVQNRMLLGLNVGRHRFLFPIFIIALVMIILWVSRLKDPLGLNTALNLIGVVVLIFPLFQIISYEIKSSTESMGASNARLKAEVANLKVPPGVNPPDIYYLILDTYTRADTLSNFFSYDNSSFLEGLQSRGFYVAGCSQSNFSYTALSLASSLNFNYPQIFSDHLTSEDKNNSDVYPYLYNNEVVSTLRALGYRFEAIDSGFSPTEFKRADIYYSPVSDWRSVLLEDGINSYESMQLNTSVGMLLYEFNSYLPSRIQKFLSAYVLHRERILFTLNWLDKMASVPGPKFVFAHILAPHNPFVFGPDGEAIERKTTFTLNDDRDVVTMAEYVTGYRDQVTYLNQRTLAIVDSLIKDSSVPPIIIIQGDHGTPRLPGWNDTILNAYYLPDGGDSQLYQSITPVNSFRVIFNQYFGGHLPLLADQSCTTDPNTNPYSCTPVKDPNPLCEAALSGQLP